MKTITQVSVQQKNKSRSNIYLDGSYYCSLDNLLVIKYGLKAGVQIDEQRIIEIQEENEFSAAFDLALGYISKYKKTKKQIIDYLLKKGYLYPIAFKVVEKLASYGFADDNDYAKSFVEQSSKSKGKLLIKMQLRARGIDEKCADNAINDIEDETPAAILIAQ
ncbi:MAG: RecX family transcriptional regulator, partial [Clostridia bacterium]|nr:RecX family transcriptional regulator [Clostridia bacterium]